jgi:hypothetical protein
MLSATSMTDPYKPIKPTPAGPRMTAITFVRTIPIAIFSMDDPPTHTEDFRI